MRGSSGIFWTKKRCGRSFPSSLAQNMLQTIRQRLSQNKEEDQKSLIILQQLSLMMSILQQLSRLKQSLSHEHDQDATELASL